MHIECQSDKENFITHGDFNSDANSLLQPVRIGRLCEEEIITNQIQQLLFI